MRTDDLRATLHHNADGLPDPGLTARAGAVRDRVALVRRRRRTSLAGALTAAVLVAAVAVVPGLVDRQEPAPAEAPATLAGQEIPETQQLAGFTYAYVKGVETDGRRLELTLPRSSAPRALTWASSPDLEGTVSVTIDGELVGRDRALGLAEGYPLYEGTAHTVVLRRSAPGPGALGLAIYEKTADLPAGISNGVATFRRSIAGDALVAGAIGEPGQRRIGFALDVPSSRLRFSDFCYGGGREDEAELFIDGRLAAGSFCDQPLNADPGPNGFTFLDRAEGTELGLVPGNTVQVEMVLPATAADDAVIGAAVYALPAPAATVAGWSVPEQTEHEGRLWSFVGSDQAPRGSGQLTVDVPASDVPQLVTVAMRDLGSSSVAVLVDGERTSGWSSNVDGGSYGHEVILQPHEPHTVRVRVLRGGTAQTQLGVVVHRQVR